MADPRRRRLALYGGAGAAAFLLALTLVQRAPPQEVEAPPAPASLPTPPPIQAQPSATPPAASPEGLRLHGITGSGAIFSGADGVQRLVRIGREVIPGLLLERVEQKSALLRSGPNRYQLGFEGAAAAPGEAPVATAQAASAGQDADNLRYRLGLAPVREGDRVIGHTIRSGAELPALARAGLRPGDTILSVNGSTLDRERVTELAWTIANSEQTEFEVRRGSRTLRLAIQ